MSSIEALFSLYERDLDRLKNEISSYHDESNIWKKEGDIANSTGNLCLHLIGNLKHFIGLHIGKVAYTRDREGEFSNTYVPKEKLISEIKETKQLVLKVIRGLSESELNEHYPIEFGNDTPTIGYMVIAMQSHLSYHL